MGTPICYCDKSHIKCAAILHFEIRIYHTERGTSASTTTFLAFLVRPRQQNNKSKVFHWLSNSVKESGPSVAVVVVVVVVVFVF